MPLYEYKCEECGLRFERRQHFSDDPVRICPDCSGVVVRLIQPAGIVVNPGIVGCGVLTSNLSQASREAVSALAEGLLEVYEDSVLFGNHPGRLHARQLTFSADSILQDS